MKCKEIQKYLALYPDDVKHDIKDKIDLHIQKCRECKAVSEKLNLYKTFTKSAEEPEVPEYFEMKVLNKLNEAQKPVRGNQYIFRIGLALSSVAAIVILILIFNPFKQPWKDAFEINFALEAEKQGKGPAESPDLRKIEQKMTEIIAETGVSIEKQQKNAITGFYDYIIIGVPGSKLSAFIEKYNQASLIPLEVPPSHFQNDGMLYLKVYFEMISFTTGNFDGDKCADLVVQFISGKNKGKWVLYQNHDSIHFKRKQEIKVGDDDTNFLGDYFMISGDYNGDGFDDICLFGLSSNRKLSTYCLINNHDLSFRSDPGQFRKLFIPEDGKFVTIVPGNADGSGKDVLWWIARLDKDQFMVTDLNSNRSFDRITVPDADSSQAIFIAGDFNCDKFPDICVKYLKGNLAARTDIFLNNQDFSFSEPVFWGLSWMGDYVIWSDDYDGDGYDDLFVKSEGPFIQGDWYVMRNNQSGRFVFEKQFQTDNP